MAARGNTKLDGFYFPWPLRNIQFARQIDQSRENVEKLAPLVRGVYVDPQPVTARDPGNHDVSAWAHGMRDFRNKYRIYYDQVNLRWALQHNVGTEAIEQWDDVITARESDGRVTIEQFGGLAAPGGFYAPVPRNLAVSAHFPLSGEWIFEHDLNTVPVFTQTWNLGDEQIQASKVDVSDPNIAYFYWNIAQAGTAMAVAEQARGEGIRVSDGTNIFPGTVRLGFNPDDFYLSNDGHGKPVVNLQPLDISSIDPDTIPVNLIVTDTDASQTFDLATISQPKIVFSRNDFYFGADIDGNPIVNVRGSFGGSTGNTSAVGAFTASTEWTLNHNLNNRDLNWAVFDDQGLAIIPSKVSVNDPNTTYFYFGNNALTGRAVVTAAGGTSTIDTSPFIRKDGTVAFTANESMGGFKLTNVGTPTVGGDATNKTYVDSQVSSTSLTVTDDVHTISTNKLTFASGGFYLDHDSAGKAVVSLRVDSLIEQIPIFVEFPLVQNIAVDPVASYPYTVENVKMDLKSGTATAGFYIVSSINRRKNGISIAGMDPISVSTVLTTTTATAARSVNINDVLVLSLSAISSPKHLRAVLTIRRT